MRRTFLWIVVLAVWVVGCKKVQLHAPPAQLDGGIVVKVFNAYARDDRIFVKTMVTNGAPQAVQVDRDGWALRLPTGEILPRAAGRTTRHTPYVLQPGETREVYVDFQRDDANFESLEQAMLIVGGISFGIEQPRVVGEIPLSRTPPYVEMYGNAPPAYGPPPVEPVPAAPPPEPPAATAPPVEPVPTDTPPAIPPAATDAAPPADAPPAAPPAPTVPAPPP
jgi:hypothetical protein